MSLASYLKNNWLKSTAMATNAAIVATCVYVYATVENTPSVEKEESVATGPAQEDKAATPRLHFSEAFQNSVLYGLPPAPSAHVMDEFSYEDGDILLNPYLVKALDEDPQARHYLRLIKEQADIYGLDWRMAANQVFRESLHFNEDVVYGIEDSARGAIGIAQFIPEKAAEYGFSAKEMTVPETAITVYARHMASLQEQYGGDVILSLIAYNGGEGAIDWARAEMDDPDADGEDIMAFLDARYQKLGNTNAHAYHVETRGYVHEILRTTLDGAESPAWVLKQNERLNSTYFVAGLINEAHVLSVMYPVYKEPVVVASSTPSPLAPETSLRPKPRPEIIRLAQN